ARVAPPRPAGTTGALDARRRSWALPWMRSRGAVRPVRDSYMITEIADTVPLRARPSCARPQAEGDGAARLGGELGGVAGLGRACPGYRARRQRALDDESGLEDLFARRLHRRQPVAHRPALAPGLVNDPDVEVTAAVAQPVAGRMQPGQP